MYSPQPAQEQTEIYEQHYEEEIARLSRLHVIGEMAAGVGHEVRNPLTTVRGFLQLMISRDQNSPQISYLQLMIDELDRANGIISEFLALAKDQAQELAPGDLNGHIHALLPLLEADAALNGKTVDVQLADSGLIELNPGQIRQLLLNLVRNGLEAVPKAGKVTIRTYAEDGKTVLAVEDNGPGIPKDKLPNIWDPFFTTKEHGSGLGLPICHRIATRHRAEIGVESGPEGTGFYVRFPKLDSASPGPVGQAAGLSRQPQKQL